MPWCDGCDRFLNPNSLRPDGNCPACDEQVAEPVAASKAEPVALAPDLPASAVDVPKAPWHFKVLVVATVGYLVWRFVELIVMVVT